MVLEKAYAQRLSEIHTINCRGKVEPRGLEGMVTNPRRDGFSFSLATMLAYLAAQAAMFVPFIILALLILWLI